MYMVQLATATRVHVFLQPPQVSLCRLLLRLPPHYFWPYQHRPPAHPPFFGPPNPPPPPPPQNQEPESSSLFGPPHLVKTVKRIPCASQDIAARKMATILQDIISLNDAPSWNGLYHFTTRCLQTPKRGGRRRSLATRSTGQFVTKWTQRYQHPPANANHRFEPLYNL